MHKLQHKMSIQPIQFSFLQVKMPIRELITCLLRMILKDGDIAHQEHHWESSALFKQAAGSHQEVRTVLPLSVTARLI